MSAVPSFKPVEKAIEKWAWDLLAQDKKVKRRGLKRVNGDPKTNIRRFKMQAKSAWDFLLGCELEFPAPKIMKSPPGKLSLNVIKEVHRLHVVQTGEAVYPKSGRCVDIIGRAFFDRNFVSTNPTQVQSLPRLDLIAAFGSADSGPGTWVSGEEDVARAFTRQLAPRLDELAAQLHLVWATTEAAADDLVLKHLQKFSGKEGAKFRTKLQKFLVATPGLLDSSPDVLLECMKIDPDDMHGLSKFLKRNSADLVFVTKDDFVEVQKVAQVQNVMDS
jgi:hypothetical protein